MSPRSIPCALAILATLWPVAGSAAGLELGEVIDSVRRTHPDLAAARAKLDGARAKTTQAEGAFDLQLSASGEFYPGEKTYAVLDVSLVQPTSLWGLAIYGGWRITPGTVPDYKDQFVDKPLKAPVGFYKTKPYTGDFGEARVGAALPLWRGRDTDKRRAKLAEAEAGIQEKDAALATKSLALELKAAEAYWKWVGAGRSLEVAEELYERARIRNEQTSKKAERGAIADMEVMETERALLQREGKVVKAKGKLQKAGIKLSLYLRTDEDDPNPRRAGRDELPAAWPSLVVPSPDELSTYVDAALERRPETRGIDAAERAVRAKRELAATNTAPQIDLGGALGVDPTKPTKPTLVLTLEASQPIQRREALGELGQAEAKLSELVQKRRAARDGIEADARAALVELVAARDAAALAQREFELADKLVSAEVVKFEEGASTALKVNIREDKRAKAAERVVETQRDLMIAWSRWRVALGASPNDPDQ